MLSTKFSIISQTKTPLKICNSYKLRGRKVLALKKSNCLIKKRSEFSLNKLIWAINKRSQFRTPTPQAVAWAIACWDKTLCHRKTTRTNFNSTTSTCHKTSLCSSRRLQCLQMIESTTTCMDPIASTKPSYIIPRCKRRFLSAMGI